ncbi:hypothetical protein FDG95_gp422 [Pectobacterium phage vB_PcaM_CBB]|uniref:Uncharacterized protein n=1 Tax=Pectobacterium phage vB_PcaM_CBB TaxID=2772511 RepID=A0A1L2CU74_9CAUD|nr:hypothetical protein FDG95_gp004 [Pectobacterium phage vB_PcaM_CBB]YP_009595097.1 hypothetical protein FDG95_gp422 [Pectobacterium phage vB_PcaM_CBB]AMM43569.1 hypothetical protein CBB_557 [Pectobacterium phage vB_PcaM_CBB]AMM44120.1 hypothetical protein CBB_4 [Pectobacterium phage vB_PcaM_CBB]
MELKPLSELRDKKTIVARTMIHTSPRQKVLSGYLVFVLDGKLIQRRIYDMAYNSTFMSAMYIVYKGVNYAVDLACKTISGAFSVETLKV